MQNTRTKNKTTIVNFILDSSGSMEECRKGTIKGFNKYLDSLREIKGKVLFSLTLFDTTITKRYSLVPLREVRRLNTENYTPDGGTALWDAAVETCEDTYDRVKGMIEEKPVILTVILTDGEENSSRLYERDCMTDLVKELQAEGNWTFVYLGANQDSWDNARTVGYNQGNVANYKATNNGMMRSMMALSVGTSNLIASAAQNKAFNTANFFTGQKDEHDNLT